MALRNKTEAMRNTGTNRVAQKGDYSKCPLAKSKFAKVLRDRIRLTDLIWSGISQGLKIVLIFVAGRGTMEREKNRKNEVI